MNAYPIKTSGAIFQLGTTQCKRRFFVQCIHPTVNCEHGTSFGSYKHSSSDFWPNPRCVIIRRYNECIDQIYNAYMDPVWVYGTLYLLYVWTVDTLWMLNRKSKNANTKTTKIINMAVLDISWKELEWTGGCWGICFFVALGVAGYAVLECAHARHTPHNTYT